MKPFWIVLAAVIALAAIVRWRRLSNTRRVLAVLAVAAAAVYGSGAVHLPNLEKTIEDVGMALGPWTYALVAVFAFLETGAFVGLVIPGETALLVGGVIAGQGRISILAVIAIAWAAAVAGDAASFFLGRRLGRQFLVRHGNRFKITEERLQQVEAFFDRHGGPTILVGRFVSIVRAIRVVPGSTLRRTVSLGARSRRASRVSCRSAKCSTKSPASRSSLPLTVK